MEVQITEKTDGTRTCSFDITEKDWRLIALQKDPQAWLQQIVEKELTRMRRKTYARWNMELMDDEKVSSIPTDKNQWLGLVESKKAPKEEEVIVEDIK